MQKQLTTDKEKKEWIKNNFTNVKGKTIAEALKKYWLKNSGENKKFDPVAFWKK